jgi:hypothetical protein
MAYSKKKPAKKAGKKKPPMMMKMSPAEMKAMKKKGK